MSCLLGVSHVLRGLACHSAAEVAAAAPPAGALLSGSRQLIAGVAECCSCVATLSNGRRLRLVLSGSSGYRSSAGHRV